MFRLPLFVERDLPRGLNNEVGRVISDFLAPLRARIIYRKISLRPGCALSAIKYACKCSKVFCQAVSIYHQCRNLDPTGKHIYKNKSCTTQLQA